MEYLQKSTLYLNWSKRFQLDVHDITFFLKSKNSTPPPTILNSSSEIDIKGKISDFVCQTGRQYLLWIEHSVELFYTWYTRYSNIDFYLPFLSVFIQLLSYLNAFFFLIPPFTFTFFAFFALSLFSAFRAKRSVWN